MKFKLLFVFLLAGQISFSQMALNNEQDSLSYALGVSIGQSLRAQNLEPDFDKMIQAMKDMKTGALLLSPDMCGMYIQSYFQKNQDKVANENLKLGNDFLMKNKARNGVVTTASGLQYEIMKAGEGAKPLASDKVKVHYHGTLIDGTVFDSSVERGSPATFGVTQVIQGWVEGLQLMPQGSKWKFFIPANLAYGNRGQGKIGPNSTLVFEVELLEVIK